MFKWGYFTELKTYDIETLLAEKPGARGEPVEILFAGRFLPLKHPEYAIRLAKALKQEEIPFHLTMAENWKKNCGRRWRPWILKNR